MKNNYCVYKHTSPSGKVYIGLTCQKPERRWQNGDGYRPADGKNTPFYLAIKKYGWENISHEIVADGLTKEEACNLEMDLINLYQSQSKEHGYNVLQGGDIPLANCPEEVKSKMKQSSFQKWSREEYRASHSGDNHWTHQKGFSEKSIDAMRRKNLGVKRTPEQVEFLREKGRNQKRLLGKENRKSIPILCLALDGTYLNKYYGAMEAQRETGVCFQNIFKVCNGERKTAGGFKWAYAMGGSDNAGEE